jgi:hypothetical protein
LKRSRDFRFDHASRRNNQEQVPLVVGFVLLGVLLVTPTAART